MAYNMEAFLQRLPYLVTAFFWISTAPFILMLCLDRRDPSPFVCTHRRFIYLIIFCMVIIGLSVHLHGNTRRANRKIFDEVIASAEETSATAQRIMKGNEALMFRMFKDSVQHDCKTKLECLGEQTKERDDIVKMLGHLGDYLDPRVEATGVWLEQWRAYLEGRNERAAKRVAELEKLQGEVERAETVEELMRVGGERVKEGGIGKKNEGVVQGAGGLAAVLT